MYSQFAVVLVFVLVGLLFVFGSLILGRIVRPRQYQKAKMAVYECGEPTIGSAWIRFNSRFYTIALVYLLFDVEVVVLMPMALVLKSLGATGFGAAALVALLVFLGVLALGLAYEWFYGNLDWIRSDELTTAELLDDEPRPAEMATTGS